MQSFYTQPLKTQECSQQSIFITQAAIIKNVRQSKIRFGVFFILLTWNRWAQLNKFFFSHWFSAPVCTDFERSHHGSSRYPCCVPSYICYNIKSKIANWVGQSTTLTFSWEFLKGPRLNNFIYNRQNEMKKMEELFGVHHWSPHISLPHSIQVKLICDQLMLKLFNNWWWQIMKTVKCPCMRFCHSQLSLCNDLSCIVWVMVPAPSLSKPSKPFFREST